MIPAKQLALSFAAVMAAGSLALPAAAQPASVTPLDVTAAAPTSVRVDVHGLSKHEVVNVVYSASHMVCRNAVAGIGLDIGDIGWCADRAQAKAMKQYAAISRDATTAQAQFIELAAR